MSKGEIIGGVIGALIAVAQAAIFTPHFVVCFTLGVALTGYGCCIGQWVQEC